MKEKTILLVEDDPLDVDRVRTALASKGIVNELVVVNDGQDALDYLFGTGAFTGRALTKLPAMILLDLGLPGVGGMEVLRQVRMSPLTKLIPVVILSSSTDDVVINAAYRFGANSYVCKKLDAAEFMKAVEQLRIYWLSLTSTTPNQAKMCLFGTEEQLQNERVPH